MKALVFSCSGEIVYDYTVNEVRPGEAEEAAEQLAAELGVYPEDITWHVEEMEG